MKQTWIEPKLELLKVNMTENEAGAGGGTDWFWVSDAGLADIAAKDAQDGTPGDDFGWLLRFFMQNTGTSNGPV